MSSIYSLLLLWLHNVCVLYICILHTTIPVFLLLYVGRKSDSQLSAMGGEKFSLNSFNSTFPCKRNRFTMAMGILTKISANVTIVWPMLTTHEPEKRTLVQIWLLVRFMPSVLYFASVICFEKKSWNKKKFRQFFLHTSDVGLITSLAYQHSRPSSTPAAMLLSMRSASLPFRDVFRHKLPSSGLELLTDLE